MNVQHDVVERAVAAWLAVVNVIRVKDNYITWWATVILPTAEIQRVWEEKLLPSTVLVRSGGNSAVRALMLLVAP